MKKTTVAIIGAGLAGLHAAWLLQRHGLQDYVLLEARPSVGGRIQSIAANTAAPADAGQPEIHANQLNASSRHGNSTGDSQPNNSPTNDCVDLGPSWFWPEFQPELDALIRQQGLARFAQQETGDLLIERVANEPPRRFSGYVGSPTSIRLVGGMASLTDAMMQGIDPARVLTGQSVRALQRQPGQVLITVEDASGNTVQWQAEHVLLALPPRLAQQSIRFDPPLPSELARQWQDTATWMAPHAKYVAVYDRPFWREQGLSGDARSQQGPLVEIHDASTPGGSAALFGFIGVPAQMRRTVPELALRTLCRAQLVRLFGPEAATPRLDLIKDWASEPLTATADDLDASPHHAGAPASTASTGPWQGYLTGIGSEWSPQFPGYVAGAIEAARLGVDRLLTAGLAKAGS